LVAGVHTSPLDIPRSLRGGDTFFVVEKGDGVIGLAKHCSYGNRKRVGVNDERLGEIKKT